MILSYSIVSRRRGYGSLSLLPSTLHPTYHIPIPHSFPTFSATCLSRISTPYSPLPTSLNLVYTTVMYLTALPLHTLPHPFLAHLCLPCTWTQHTDSQNSIYNLHVCALINQPLQIVTLVLLYIRSGIHPIYTITPLSLSPFVLCGITIIIPLSNPCQSVPLIRGYPIDIDHSLILLLLCVTDDSFHASLPPLPLPSAFNFIIFRRSFRLSIYPIYPIYTKYPIYPIYYIHHIY